MTFEGYAPPMFGTVFNMLKGALAPWPFKTYDHDSWLARVSAPGPARVLAPPARKAAPPGRGSRVNASVLTLVAIAGGKALAMACTIGAAVVVGRLLGAATLGKWTLLLAAGTLLHTFLVNWTHGATIRYGREEFVRTGTMRRTLTARLPLLVASVAAATALLVWQPGGWLERWFAAAPSQAATVALLAVSVWIASEAQATLQATDRVIWQALLAPLAGVASILAVLMAATLGPLSLDRAAVAFALPSIVIWGTAWFFSLVARPGEARTRRSVQTSGGARDTVFRCCRLSPSDIFQIGVAISC